MVILPVQWGRAQANVEIEACNFFYFKTDLGRAWQEYFPVFRLKQLKVIYLVSSPGLAGRLYVLGVSISWTYRDFYFLLSGSYWKQQVEVETNLPARTNVPRQLPWKNLRIRKDGCWEDGANQLSQWIDGSNRLLYRKRKVRRVLFT